MVKTIIVLDCLQLYKQSALVLLLVMVYILIDIIYHRFLVFIPIMYVYLQFCKHFIFLSKTVIYLL